MDCPSTNPLADLLARSLAQVASFFGWCLFIIVVLFLIGVTPKSILDALTQQTPTPKRIRKPIANFESQCEKLKDQLYKEREDHRSTKQSFSMRLRRIPLLEEEIRDHKRSIEAQQGELKSIQHSVKERTDLLSDFEYHLERSENEVQSLENDIQELQRKNDELAQDNKNFIYRLAHFPPYSGLASDKIKALVYKKADSAARAFIASLDTSQSSQPESSTDKDEISMLKQKLADSNASLSSITTELNETNDSLLSIQKKLDTTKNTLRSTQNELKLSKESLSAAERKINDANMATALAKGKANISNNKVRGLEKDKFDLQTRIDGLERATQNNNHDPEQCAIHLQNSNELHEILRIASNTLMGAGLIPQDSAVTGFQLAHFITNYVQALVNDSRKLESVNEYAAQEAVKLDSSLTQGVSAEEFIRLSSTYIPTLQGSIERLNQEVKDSKVSKNGDTLTLASPSNLTASPDVEITNTPQQNSQAASSHVPAAQVQPSIAASGSTIGNGVDLGSESEFTPSISMLKEKSARENTLQWAFKFYQKDQDIRKLGLEMRRIFDKNEWEFPQVDIRDPDRFVDWFDADEDNFHYFTFLSTEARFKSFAAQVNQLAKRLDKKKGKLEDEKDRKLAECTLEMWKELYQSEEFRRLRGNTFDDFMAEQEQYLKSQ